MKLQDKGLIFIQVVVMPNIEKAKRRDRKRKKKRDMSVSGKSVFLIQEILRKRQQEILRDKEKRNERVTRDNWRGEQDDD